MAYVDFHLLVQTIVHDQAMSHSNAVWFHRMACDVGIVSNIRIIEVSDFPLAFGGAICAQRIKGSERAHSCNMVYLRVRK